MWPESDTGEPASAKATRQYRAAIALDYSFKEGKWFTVSVGKDFLERDTGSLFSLANLTWSVGEPKVAKASAAATATP